MSNLAAMTLQGFRWWYLLRAFLPDLKLRTALYYHFTGMYYSVVLPTSAAQDIVRTVMLSQKHDYGVAWGATWIYRIMGLITWAGLSVYGLSVIPRKGLPAQALPAICAMAGVLAVLVLLSFSKTVTRPMGKWATRVFPAKFTNVAERIREAVYLFRQRPGTLVVAAFTTIATMVLLVLNPIIVLAGITGRAFWGECFAYFPIIEILSTTIPLTPSGLGVREFFTGLLFREIGIEPAILGAFVTLSVVSAIGLKLLGGIPLLFGLGGRRPSE